MRIAVENIQQDDLLPRLKILMQLSPELEEMENAKAGMIYNTVTTNCMTDQNATCFARYQRHTLSGLIEDKDRVPIMSMMLQ